MSVKQTKRVIKTLYYTYQEPRSLQLHNFELRFEQLQQKKMLFQQNPAHNCIRCRDECRFLPAPRLPRTYPHRPKPFSVWVCAYFQSQEFTVYHIFHKNSGHWAVLRNNFLNFSNCFGNCELSNHNDAHFNIFGHFTMNSNGRKTSSMRLVYYISFESHWNLFTLKSLFPSTFALPIYFALIHLFANTTRSFECRKRFKRKLQYLAGKLQ